ncbi:glycoside hydrolase family 99-like domain-containing protein [Olivibacter sitiensis]|uniref:glycoside hydrolase family 99-like domain-containing protein n=1 Tax=Olivibacter sitiensis TaxID=376470 RepID=UPI0004190661|nr:glycoside hydrolase family 99-like domain-containing protein [Olivibacter sitiensis]
MKKLIGIGLTIIGVLGCYIASEAQTAPLKIPKGKVEVAAYYFPNWGPFDQSEWPLIQRALPRFEGHQQPKTPLWGYENEEDPIVMTRKIKAAADHHINSFIFCWYYFDPASLGKPGGKYLYKALEEGFLKAANRSDMKFALMWANHDVDAMKGAIMPETFEEMTDYIIAHYFKEDTYWKIEGCPYFSIYEPETFIQSYGDDVKKAGEALQRFRAKVKAAGFPDLHLNLVISGLRGRSLNDLIEYFPMKSTASYVWVQHNKLQGFPTSDYNIEADRYFRSVAYGGGLSGLENPVSSFPVSYYINVTMGWDASPRTRNSADWMNRQEGYPFGAVLVNNTPYNYKKALIKAKEITLKKSPLDRIIMLNAWNEWGEGSYLEPDTIHKYDYLEVIKEVFEK